MQRGFCLRLLCFTRCIARIPMTRQYIPPVTEGTNAERIAFARRLFRKYNGGLISNRNPFVAKDEAIKEYLRICDELGGKKLLLSSPFYLAPDYFPVLQTSDETFEIGFTLKIGGKMIGRVLEFKVTGTYVVAVLQGMSIVFKERVPGVVEKSDDADAVAREFVDGPLDCERLWSASFMDMLPYTDRVELDSVLNDRNDEMDKYLGCTDDKRSDS